MPPLKPRQSKQSALKPKKHQNAMLRALDTLTLSKTLHIGKEAENVRECMASNGLKKEADQWKNDVASMVKALDRIPAIVAEVDGIDNSNGDKTDVLLKKVGEVMDEIRNVSMHMALWYRMMAGDGVLQGLQSEACVQRFFKFLQKLFNSSAEGLELTMKSMSHIKG